MKNSQQLQIPVMIPTGVQITGSVRILTPDRTLELLFQRGVAYKLTRLLSE